MKHVELPLTRVGGQRKLMSGRSCSLSFRGEFLLLEELLQLLHQVLHRHKYVLGCAGLCFRSPSLAPSPQDQDTPSSKPKGMTTATAATITEWPERASLAWSPAHRFRRPVLLQQRPLPPATRQLPGNLSPGKRTASFLACVYACSTLC